MNKGIFSIVFTLLFFHSAFSQMIELDKGILAGDLWCFPVYGDSLNYKYLPASDGGHIATGENDLPKFSFLRYVIEDPNHSGNNTISQAGGGAILTFLIEYATKPIQISNSEKILKERIGNQVVLSGPVLIKSAKYTIVSSILQADGAVRNQIFATGNAPVLESSQIAFSFDLSPQRSKLLLENFKMSTPDITIIFELEFSGLSDYYDANLHIDWSKVNYSKSFGAGGSVYFVGADVERGFDELIQESAITLNTVGSNQNMELLLNTVYEKLLTILFTEIEPSQVPPNEQRGLTDALSSIFRNKGIFNSRNLTGFGFNAHYKLKELKTSGVSDLNFNGRSTLDRYHFITCNIGDLYQKYGSDEFFFRDIPLYDKAFQQRDVIVGVDGSLESEFDQMVNHVAVKLKKEHLSSDITLKELLVNKTIFDSLGQLKFTYLNNGDEDLQKWLDYQYQTNWQFVGGGSFKSEWIPSNSPVINLHVPFHRKKIFVEGDLGFLLEKGIRATIVQIQYSFFDELKKESLSIRPSENFKEKYFEITLPQDQDEVEYKIIWIMKDGSRIEQKGVDNIGILFIDELPAKG